MNANDGAGVRRLGGCVACGRGAVDDPYCRACLGRRTARWVELHRRVLDDPAFALAVFETIKTSAGRELFVRAYGVPTGAVGGRGDA